LRREEAREAKRAAGADVRTHCDGKRLEAVERLHEIRRLIRCKIKLKKSQSLSKTFRGVEQARGDSVRLWKLWHGHRRGLSPSSALPGSILDHSGVAVTDPVGILKAWTEYGRRLGRDTAITGVTDYSDRCEAPNAKFDDDFAKMVLQRVANISNVNGIIPELESAISWEEVHSATCRLKTASAAGLDDITVSMLQNLGVRAEVALTSLFNRIWTELDWPLE
jgi:hypothetical protein